MSQTDLTALEHDVLLRAFGLHGVTRQLDDAIAAACSLEAWQVVATRETALGKLLEAARSKRDRFGVLVEVLKAHPDALGDLLRRLVPAVHTVKQPRPKREKREQTTPVPAFVPVVRPPDGRAVWDAALQAKVVRVSRADFDRGRTMVFHLGNAKVDELSIIRDRWPSNYAVGIYWFTDDTLNYIVGIDWQPPHKPLRDTIGDEPSIIALDDATDAELADAQWAKPLTWKDD